MPAALPRCAGCASTSTDGDARLGRAARKIDSPVSGPFSRLELASRAHANWWVGASLGPGATGPAKVVAGHAGPTGTVLTRSIVVSSSYGRSGRLAGRRSVLFVDAEGDCRAYEICVYPCSST